MIYLDYAASTPADERVVETFVKATKKYFANPNSIHKLGKEAKSAIEEASKNISNMFGADNKEVIYTSGASESNNLAIKGICERYKNRGKHILLSSLEHTSLLASATSLTKAGFEVEILPVNKEGKITIKELKEQIREDTILVSICSVDSELGIIQPIEEIATFLTAYPNCVFHTDASQAIGKIAINFENVDLITIAPHKFYGIEGIGALLKKKEISLIPQIDGGRSTTIYRSGTPQTSHILSLEKALELANKYRQERTTYIEELSNHIKKEIREYKNITINTPVGSIPHIINFSISGIAGNELVRKMEDHNICISAKTSCCPEATPSKLVYALTKNKNLAKTSVRISLSHLTTKEEVKYFLETVKSICKEYNHGKI